MSTNNKISSLISSQVPFFVRNDHPNFVLFLQKYFEYLEQDNQVVQVAKDNIPVIRDIDLTSYEENLYDEFLKLIPENVTVDKNLLLKNIKDFYRAKGTENSIRFLINILYGHEDLEFYYPKKDVLRASDGKWFIQRSLRVTDTSVNSIANSNILAISNFNDKIIRGNTSGATATVERVDRFFEKGTQIDELIISNILGNFVNNEQVFTVFSENGITKSLTSNVFGGIINTVTVTNAGSGYIVGDNPIVESNSGAGANLRVSRVSTGNIASITVIDGGAGYQTNSFALFSGGGAGSGANAELTLVLNDSSVHPNSYNIIFSTVSVEANTNTTNSIANNIYQSFAYQNLNVIYTNTSNIRANSGVSLASLNLSSWLANSNVYFETFDSLNVTNQISGVSNTVLITATNTRSNLVYISPAFATRQSNLVVRIIKRANANTTLINALPFYVYANTGPARTVTVRNAGTNYTELPSISIIANTGIQELEILGKMVINNGGSGYQIGNIIQFNNEPGGYGTGANAIVSNISGTGAITAVKFVPRTGQIVGGSGYNVLPTANVISGTGNGANIAVTHRLGEGASFILTNSTLGSIQEIQIVNRGSGYTDVPTINLRSLGDGTATANATILEGVFTYPGRYLNDDGFVSSYNFLQDRDYYQNFSYVLRLKESIANYRKAIKQLVHPAGMKLFGQYLTIDEQDGLNNSEGGLEAITRSLPIPTLSIDFTTGNLDSNVTFTRSSNASFVNSFGYISYVTANVARFTHDPETLRPLGIRVEPQATNLLLYSNNFTNLWSNTGNTIITSGLKSPDGNNNAYLLYDSNLNNDASFIDQNITITPSATQRHTYSIFAKANTANAFAIYCFYTGTTVNGSSVIVNNFNTNNPTVTAAIAEGGEELPSNVVLENYIDGWKRLSFTTFNRNGLNNNIVFRVYPATRDPGITGATLFFGPQLETGNVATTYIPTGSATVTRSSDYLAVQNTAFTNVFNQIEGTVFVQGSTIDYVVNNGDYPVAIALANSFSRDTNCIVFGSDRTSNPPANDSYMSAVKNGFNNDIQLDRVYVGKSFRAAFAYEDGNLPKGNIILALDGISSNKASANIPNVNILYISQTARFQPQYPHNIEKVVYYNKELSNTTMIQLTTKP
jgi:hypothetical protein